MQPNNNKKPHLNNKTKAVGVQLIRIKQLEKCSCLLTLLT